MTTKITTIATFDTLENAQAFSRTLATPKRDGKRVFFTHSYCILARMRVSKGFVKSNDHLAIRDKVGSKSVMSYKQELESKMIACSA